jgi:hypothetical protein
MSEKFQLAVTNKDFIGCLRIIKNLTGMGLFDSKNTTNEILVRLGHKVNFEGDYYWKGSEPFYVYEIGDCTYDKLPSWNSGNNIKKILVRRV